MLSYFLRLCNWWGSLGTLGAGRNSGKCLDLDHKSRLHRRESLATFPTSGLHNSIIKADMLGFLR